MAETPASLPPPRRFLRPLPDETIEQVAARAAASTDDLRLWNPHIFATRRPPGLFTVADIVFTEPPGE